MYYIHEQIDMAGKSCRISFGILNFFPFSFFIEV